jgi:GNAT superfamily N-acetyltransferase
MVIQIRPLAEPDVEPVVALSLRAWAPVFASFAEVLGQGIYRHIYPDWRTAQARAVEQTCRENLGSAWVAVDGGTPVGFAVVVWHEEPDTGTRSGEIEMIAVDPPHQRRGIAGELIEVAVDRMRAEGVALAIVATGGDPGHAPARGAYEKAGFTPLPIVRYYREL